VAQPWHGLGAALRRFLHQDNAVRRAYTELGRTLALPGRWGLDGLVHRVDGALALRPVVERNARVTMGHIAAGMARHVRAGRPALWWVDHRIERARALIADHPLVATDGVIQAGCVPTNDPGHAQGFLGVLCVGADAVEEARVRGAAELSGRTPSESEASTADATASRGGAERREKTQRGYAPGHERHPGESDPA
jgi:hypothetical protein